MSDVELERAARRGFPCDARSWTKSKARANVLSLTLESSEVGSVTHRQVVRRARSSNRAGHRDMEAGGEKRAADDALPEEKKPSKKGKIGNRGNQGNLDPLVSHTQMLGRRSLRGPSQSLVGR